MQPFNYSNSPFPIREDLIGCFAYTWDKFSQPGTWLTAAERVAVAREVRNAQTCQLCADRKAALSPFGIDGVHNGDHEPLSDLQVDIAHRLTTDASRLTETWLRQCIDQSHSQGNGGTLTDASYIEILSVVVSTLAIDSFHNALGFEHEPLPQPLAGEPSHHRPTGATSGTAWVPMVSGKDVDPIDADMYGGATRTGNVITAMSLVPDAVRLLMKQSNAMYVHDVIDFSSNSGRALSRPQIELIAARVSALNDCFY
ncbi:MAG: alkylhydroperoxidase-related (seleno)protein [Proteobacteria bacterium]|nr:alkylhydroperoxidase-related (seleno)protein [Pseudomonadota bacterium]